MKKKREKKKEKLGLRFDDSSKLYECTNVKSLHYTL